MAPVTARYADGDDPAVAGVCAAASSAHLAAHPDHTLAWLRETTDEFEARMLADQARDDAERESMTAGILARQHQPPDMPGREGRRERERPIVELYIPRRTTR